MTAYRLWPATDGPAVPSSEELSYTLGVEFYVTDSGATFDAWHWWCQAVNDFTFTLWEVIDGDNGTQVAQVTGQGAGFSVGAWNRVALPVPYALTPNQRYRATIHSLDGVFYCNTGNYWAGGGPGSAGITNGPLIAPSAANATGGDQGQFLRGDFPAYPTDSFASSNYWIDAEVSLPGDATGVLAASIPEVTVGPPTTNFSGTVAEPTYAGTLNAALPVVTVGPVSVTASGTFVPPPPSGIDEPIAAIIAIAQHCVCTTFTDLCECCGHSGTSLPPASDCCDCEPGKNGRAYIQVERVFPIGKPTTAKASQGGCGVRMAVEFAVTIYRCVDTIDREGHPDCETTTAEMYRNIKDMRLVREALLCCMRDEVDDNSGFSIQIIEQSPLTPEGGCGGTLTKAVASADRHILQSDILTVL